MQKLAQTFSAYNLKQCFKKTHVYYWQIRCLNLLECDSKNLLQKYGVNVQNFITVNENEDIKDAMQNMNFKAEKYVVKAQISAGGRGRGVFDNGYQGGVHIADNIKTIENITRNMFGHRLVTQQTLASGITVKKVMIADCLNIRHESYFCIALDGFYNGPIIIASKNGGTDIEEIYKHNSDSIKLFPVNITEGITDELCNNLVKCLGFSHKLHDKVSQQIISTWNLFSEIDAVQLEINPFVETETDEIIAVDAKIVFDDNALFRQREIEKLHEEMKSELAEEEIKASQYNLNYIKLDGNIGCLVNGAGLAMATMDIIKLYGGRPANFLDVGGSVTESQVAKAMKILLLDKNVKSILINVFGGIVDCTTIANGIVRTRKETEIHKPLVLRFEGNNNEKAKEAIAEFDYNFRIYIAEDLHEAAQLVIASIS